MQSCIPEGTEVNSQYSTLQDYEQFPIHYSSSPKYATKSIGLPLPEIGIQYSYHNASTLSSSQAQLPTSSQEIDIGGSQDHVPVSFARFMHAPQYDEMPKYRMTDVPTFGADPHYESDTNYEISSASLNSNTFFSKTLISDERPNESKSSPEFNMKAYNDPTVNQNSLDFSMHGKKDDDNLIENLSSGICSTMRWRDPNLSEVISFLDNPNSAIQANAAAYLQHLCYMDDANKQKTRTLGGIPSLIRLLSNDNFEIHKNACGALRNLSYGRQNDENKRAINNAAGIPALVKLLCKTQDSGVKELVTGVLWNMSSCEDVKRSIIDESLTTIVRNVIKPHSGWDPVCSGDVCYTVVFRNSSGVLRNISSAGMYARTSLRNSKHLVECLLYVIKSAIEENNIGSKTVENCVCTLRNISYRCQEVDDPNYDKLPPVTTTRNSASSSKGENLGCFGTSKKKKDFFQPQQDQVVNTVMPSVCGTFKGYEILWQPEVVQYYLALLQSCSNPETLEAAAGALQNLSACYWQPSIDIRATVRKEKGLPILVELLRMEVDRVVCAVATALRNLAIDQRNKELIGKYAMRDLVQKLPSGNPQQDQTTSDDTISAVLATINEVIKKNPEFSRSLLDAGGIERLLNITRQWQKYTACVVKFASQVLFTMWQHHELRDVYKKNGWREQDFLLKSSIAQNMVLNLSNNTNNTLSRPMASQGGTRYEDKTIQRAPTNSKIKNGDKESGKESSMLNHKVDDFVMNVDNDETYQHETETCSTSNFLSSNKRS